VITGPVEGSVPLRVFFANTAAPIASLTGQPAALPPVAVPVSTPMELFQLFTPVSAPVPGAPAPMVRGVRLAGVDLDGDQRAEILVGRLEGEGPIQWSASSGATAAAFGNLQVFDGVSGQLEEDLSPFPGYTGGVFVGGG
jgi:hypothetical protein